MPRTRRFAPVGTTFHVVNRGNERRQIFFDDEDYRRFLQLLRIGKERCDVKVFGFCPMPNHFHMVLRPDSPDALSDYLHFVSTCYATDVRAKTSTRGLGHVFQRRFWSCGIEGADHFYAVLRYVEANARRASLVSRAEDWQWGSLFLRREGDDSLLDASPFELPEDWVSVVNAPLFDRELVFARHQPRRGRPCLPM